MWLQHDTDECVCFATGAVASEMTNQFFSGSTSTKLELESINKHEQSVSQKASDELHCTQIRPDHVSLQLVGQNMERGEPK